MAALRADLRTADFTVDVVEGLLGPVAAAALHREQPVPALGATQDAREPAAVLLRLFLLGADVRRGALAAALPGLGADGAEQLGLIRSAGPDAEDPVRAVVDLRPYAVVDAAGPVSWWLASDLGEMATGGPLPLDHVLGVGGASTMLAQITPRTPRRRTLDLGTGCGVQALHASRHSETVVGTDVSARALAFAGFNADLAGVDLDLRHGSLFQPLARDGAGAEQFDLLVSNPPFVITPRGGGGTGGVPVHEYRDGGMAGDDLVRSLVLGARGVLAPGGVAQLLGNWEHRAGEDWRERVGSWLDAAGLDGWVVQRELLDPAEYAEMWLRDGGTTQRDAGWRHRCALWLEDFASREVEAVGLGLLVLRRPVDGVPTLRRVEECSGPARQPLGDHLAAVLAAHDWLRGRDDAGLLAARLVTAPDVTEERHLRPGADDPSMVLLRQGDGFGRTAPVGTALA
ncbi:MAG: methyltransferase small, partial [Actinotalea sp.]|nr:methyltransferase small [Actinotalea sp.]